MDLRWVKTAWLQPLLALCAALLLGALAVASLGGTFVGEEYYHARIAQGGIASQDALAPMARVLAYTPYHAALSVFGSVLPLSTAATFLGILLGVGAVLLFFNVLLAIGFSADRSFVASLAVLLTPAFLQAFGSATPVGMVLVISLGAFLLYAHARGVWMRLAASVLVVLASLFGPLHAFMALVLLGVALAMERRRMGALIFLVLALICALIVRMHPVPLLGPARFPFGVLSDLGFMPGIGVFLFLAAALGSYGLWRRKRELWVGYGLLVACAVVTFWIGRDGIYYLMLVLALFAAVGIARLLESRWESEYLRQFTLLLVVFGLIFSSLTYLVHAPQRTDPGLLAASRWLATEPAGGVLSVPEHGFLIEAQGKKRPVVDELSGPAERAQAASLLQQRNPEIIRDAFQRQGIRYVLIDQTMRSGGVWTRDEQGLLFVLQRSGLFRLAYEGPGAQVWVFTQR